MFGASRYFAMKNKASQLPEVSLTEKEFIRLMMETGKTKKEAALQAKFAKTMGSSVMIGDKMVSISDAPSEQDKANKVVVEDAKKLVDGVLKKHGLKGLKD